MSFSTYGGLKAAIADWLDRGDLASRIPDFVTLATATLNKVMRDRRMVANDTVTVIAGSRRALAPAGMLEPLLLTHTANEDFPLERISTEALVRLRRTRFLAPGQPRYYCVVGGWLELAPTSLGTVDLDLSYYGEIPPLSADGDSNWVLADEPDIYLYTALLHAAQFLHDPALAAQIQPLLETKIAAAVGVVARTDGGAS